ncbi:hypothetical protein K7432_004605 [Basidiobolus ranarum]|uniref:Calcineurin-like phosphoesterase domain-containing protein n=1 Tax=Basidiobolus ranarum TaxID=34480 RepID=A0ABR2WY26_9FUNG
MNEGDSLINPRMTRSSYVAIENLGVDDANDKFFRNVANVKVGIWKVVLLTVSMLLTCAFVIYMLLPNPGMPAIKPKMLLNHSRIIVIGDVHGNLEPFDRLLRVLDMRDDDTLVLAGDLVTKGPDSIGVLKRAKEVGALCIRGNHDNKVIQWRKLLAKYGEQDIQKIKLPPGLDWKTEHYKLASTLPEDLFQYLEGCSIILSIPRFSMYVVHAGINPFLSIEQQKSKEVMNMRSIVSHKPTKKKQVGKPWWDVWNAQQVTLQHPKTVVYGHEASSGLNIQEYTIGLDTGCARGRKLSAMTFPEHTLVQVKC